MKKRSVLKEVLMGLAESLPAVAIVAVAGEELEEQTV